MNNSKTTVGYYALVKAVSKRAMPSYPVDYRQISLVSCVGRVYEGILTDALLEENISKIAPPNMVLWLIDKLWVRVAPHQWRNPIDIDWTNLAQWAALYKVCLTVL